MVTGASGLLFSGKLKDLAISLEVNGVSIYSDQEMSSVPHFGNDIVYYQFVNNVSVALNQVLKTKTKKNMIVLDFLSIEDSYEVLASSSQHNLIHNNWIIVYKSNADQALEIAMTYFPQRKQLNPFSKIFLVQDFLVDIWDMHFHQLIGNINYQPHIKALKQK